MRFVAVASLPDYALAFTRWSLKRACGVADLVAAIGDTVWGAVFDLSDEDFGALDRYEGATLVPPAYRRISAMVQTQEGRMLSAITYEVAAKSVDLLKPSLEYMGHIIRGAERWKLPMEYVEALQRIEVQ